jgi:hypothetical protein
MQKQVFLGLIAGGVLALPPGFAQSGTDWRQLSNLTPFQAWIASVPKEDSVRAPVWHLQIQLSKDLMASPALHFELLNFIGVPVYQFELSPRSLGGREVRFAVSLPTHLNQGLYQLTVRTPEGSLEHSLTLPYPGEEDLP